MNMSTKKILVLCCVFGSVPLCRLLSVSLTRLSPTVLKRFENYLRQRNCSWNTVSTYIRTVRSVYHRAVDRKYIRYVPRLFEHVYTGTRVDRKKALEASDISSLVRETERSLQGGTLPNTQQRTRIFFVLMFMLRGIPFVDLAYLHKRDLYSLSLIAVKVNVRLLTNGTIICQSPCLCVLSVDG